MGDPKALAFGAATDFLTGDIVDALRRDYRPDLILRVAQAQAEAAEWQMLYDGALVEYATLLVGGVDITIFASPSEVAVSALVIAQANYDLARAAREAASLAYYVAFDAAVNTVPTEPFCDSRELGVALRAFCAQPLPVIDPADEDYPGQSDFEAGIVAYICGIVAETLVGVEITSNGGNSSASITIDEGNAAVTTITATQDGFTDLPANTPTFAIFGGVDQALFEIDADTGVLSFRTGPSFEVPEDADGDNAYLVDVIVSDANGSTDTQALSIAIANIEGAADPDDSGNILFTQRVIANFMGRRAHQITSNEPDLVGRLGRTRDVGEPRVTAPVSITGSSSQGFIRMAFSANLTAMATSGDAARKADYEEWRQGQFSERNKAAISQDTSRVDVWVQ